MQKKHLFFFFFLLLIKPLQAQVNLSVYAEVSIITGAPGTELYEAFGHSAIRIKDPLLKLDLIYNYGMFDFNAPNFYLNFTKGKLLYKLVRYDFKYFLNSYKSDKRWVKEQILNLSQKEKQAFFSYLENNALPQNATYLYDPYFNNCATKLRDITSTILGDRVTFKNDSIKKNLSFRQLMNRKLHWNTWGNFGINLALGSKLDQTASLEQYMYLPDYVYQVFKKSTLFINNQPNALIKKEVTLLDFKEVEQKTSILNPLLIFSLIAFIGIFITFKDFKNTKRNKVLDFTLLFTSGILGVLILFLWFFTDHATAPNNFNFLWAFAPNLILAFLLVKKNQPKWMHAYFKTLLVLLVLIPVLWILKVQLFPLAAIPLLILLFVRYLFLASFYKK